MINWIEKENYTWVSRIPNFLDIFLMKHSKWKVHFLSNNGNFIHKELKSDNEKDAKNEVETIIKESMSKYKWLRLEI